MIDMQIIVSYFIGILFLISSVNKIMHPRDYQDIIIKTLNYNTALSKLLYISSLIVELIVPLMLFFHIAINLTFLGVILLLLTYSVFLVKSHQKNVACGCIFISSEKKSILFDLSRNIFLISILFYFVVLNTQWYTYFNISLITAIALVVNYFTVAKMAEQRKGSAT